MLETLLVTFILSSEDGLLDEALKATEAPRTLRAAFTAELSSETATRTVTFDPRAPKGVRWSVTQRNGVDETLDEVIANWGNDAAPDGWLFPDDLRASVASTEVAEVLGPAWRIRFQHQMSSNDGALDAWAAETLEATVWVDPLSERFLRIDHELPRPVRGPMGGTLTRFHQTYLLETDARWGVSYVSAFSVDMAGRATFARLSRRYEAKVTELELFFASRDAERAFLVGHGDAD